MKKLALLLLFLPVSLHAAMTDAQAMRAIFDSMGPNGRAIVTRTPVVTWENHTIDAVIRDTAGNKTVTAPRNVSLYTWKDQAVAKCVVNITMLGPQTLGCGTTWEKAFADVKAKFPATTLKAK